MYISFEKFAFCFDAAAATTAILVLSVGGDKKPAAAADMRVTGDGDFAACRKKLRPLLLGSENSSVSIGGTYQPSLPLSRKFFGFSEYWYCMEDVLGIGGHYSYKKFLKSNQVRRPLAPACMRAHALGVYESLRLGISYDMFRRANFVLPRSLEMVQQGARGQLWTQAKITSELVD